MAGGDEDWIEVPLYGDAVRVWRASAGTRWRVAVAGGAPVTFERGSTEALEALLIALADVKRALTNEDFVPAKTQGHRGVRDADAGVPVRFDPEDLEYLRMRVRVGKEESLDGAVTRAVKAYMRHLLHDQFGEPDGEDAPRPAARSQRKLPGAPQGVSGVGTTQLALLRVAARKGYLTRVDVGRVYGVTARKGGAASARRRTEAYVNALVARGLLRYAPRADGEASWDLTETGRVAVEESG